MAFSSSLFVLNGPATKYEKVQISSGPRGEIFDNTLKVPLLSGSPACSALVLLINILYLSI